MYSLVNFLFEILNWAIMIRILLSWIPHDHYHPAIQVLYQITDPILEPFKRLIPPISGIDISPILAFIALKFLRDLILGIL